MFNAKGYATTKIDDVAHAAGVTKGTVYLYFDSKEELFKAAIREVVLPNREHIKTVALAEKGARERLHASLAIWAAGLSACRGSLTKLMISEGGNFRNWPTSTVKKSAATCVRCSSTSSTMALRVANSVRATRRR